MFPNFRNVLQCQAKGMTMCVNADQDRGRSSPGSAATFAVYASPSYPFPTGSALRGAGILRKAVVLDKGQTAGFVSWPGPEWTTNASRDDGPPQPQCPQQPFPRQPATHPRELSSKACREGGLFVVRPLGARTCFRGPLSAAHQPEASLLWRKERPSGSSRW